ncbi:MAG: hypothetical protein JNK12_08595 [Acidimicrobiales bacterium]|nr:hypothetical protein [Acidimicrobiales bacterium]
MRVRTRNKVAALVIALTVMLTAGLAVALWTANGTGSGNARALTAQTITVNATTGTADLYPGFNDGDVHFTLTNTNPYDVTFDSMTPGAITSSNPGACPSTNVTASSATGLSLSVGANATSSAQSIANVVSMDSGAPDGCQGVTFSIALTLTGSQD